MGQIFRLDPETGEHVSTGKWPYPAGLRHAPQWGRPYHDGPVEMVDCTFPDCDSQTGAKHV
jgi:hypothetical protein